MAAFHVGTSSTGERVWWDWQGRSFESHYTDVRDATPEEAKIMERIVWGNDLPGDCRKVKEMIAARC